jgi:hypothetical protein
MTRLAWLTTPQLSPTYALAAAAAGRRLVHDRLRSAAVESLPSPQARDFGLSNRLRRHLTRWATAAAASDDGEKANQHATARAAVAEWEGVAEVAAFEHVFAECVPRLASELPLRTRPFLELWEARGPGLLRQLSLRLNGTIADRDCLVAWVYPATGGGGWSAPGEPIVFFEAVLTNPFEPLSELLRLAWLVAQATIPATIRQELEENARRAADAAGLDNATCLVDAAGSASSAFFEAALIPQVLAAGEHVELAIADVRHTALALQAWMGLEPAQAASFAERLMPLG